MFIGALGPEILLGLHPQCFGSKILNIEVLGSRERARLHPQHLYLLGFREIARLTFVALGDGIDFLMSKRTQRKKKMLHKVCLIELHSSGDMIITHVAASREIMSLLSVAPQVST